MIVHLKSSFNEIGSYSFTNFLYIECGMDTFNSITSVISGFNSDMVQNVLHFLYTVGSDGTKTHSATGVCRSKWYSWTVLTKNPIGGGSSKDTPILKLVLGHRKIEWSSGEREIFFITWGAPRELPFIGWLQGHFRDESVS